MIVNILAMLVFLYLVCLWDTFKTTDRARSTVNFRESYFKTWWDIFLANNIIYITVAIPAAFVVVVGVEIIKLFTVHY